MTQKTWFTADQHLGHANIVKYAGRPFGSVEEMNEALVENWNRVVGDEDVAYQLGDLAFVWNDLDAGKKLIARLKGRICFVPGCHDSWWTCGEKHGWGGFKSASREYVWRYRQIERVEFPELSEDGGKHPLSVVLCHYPLVSWPGSFHGAMHLHGHGHGHEAFMQNPGGDSMRRLNVGVDVANGRPFGEPLSLETVVAMLKPQAFGEAFLKGSHV